MIILRYIDYTVFIYEHSRLANFFAICTCAVSYSSRHGSTNALFARRYGKCIQEHTSTELRPEDEPAVKASKAPQNRTYLFRMKRINNVMERRMIVCLKGTGTNVSKFNMGRMLWQEEPPNIEPKPQRVLSDVSKSGWIGFKG
eukprot:511445_1